ncbi:type III secretion system chaperone family protein [Psychrobacter lutiphocae]|uniref:hypothetical protein n=1 Tax=Psychrobacter lutiphocae TaxID=540500 RepID=UPI00035FD1EC|nr:hypothetical protein [Psychrobacter lutiphocae]
MSRYKKPSFWQRLKYLITAQKDKLQTDSIKQQGASQDNAVPVTTDSATNLSPDQSHLDEAYYEHLQQQEFPLPQMQPAVGNDQASMDTYPEDTQQADGDIDWFMDLEPELQGQDTTKGLSNSMHRQKIKSDKPITDSILRFLEDSEFSYYYHNQDGSDGQDSADSQDQADRDADQQDRQYDRQQASEDGHPVRNVHHISMAMRYYKPPQDTDGQSDQQATQATGQVDSGEIEWGCVIRIHEHTQLVAIYGVLPFQLPSSHLQAGLTLAAQLNYDMMLGCVEVDIRDGEIRFKNSLDFEPIIESNQGEIPAVVISYLLKGVMAMTASFEPLFRDLINSDPKDFELLALLDKRQQAQLDSTFFLASTTRQ